MRDEQKVFQLLRENTTSIYPLAQEITGPLFEKHFTERRFYVPTFIAYNLSPKPVTAELLWQRTPYMNPESLGGILADTAEEGYLERDGEGGYLISEKGKAIIDEIHDSFYGHINKVNQFPEEKMMELISLLDKLVEACAITTFPTGNPCFEVLHNGHPAVEPGTLARVDQLLDDMNAFRDDAHIAAFTPVGVSGQVWETLTFIWNGEANTLEKLVERLPFRFYTAEDYTKALEDLTQRGWIQPGDDGYTTTETGQKIRDDAEAQTNTNYFAPWKVLSDEELTRLEDLLAELKGINLKIVETNQTD
jgi:ribosomal protein S19E (S16A)